MKEDARARRDAQIAEAAYALLAEKGYGGLSMLAVARRARASNETLYRWYGDKTGLFRALIARNAAQIATALDRGAADADDPLDILRDLGPRLLTMLLSDRAVALNRAAAADATDSLGAVLAEAGRGAILPRIQSLFTRLAASGVVRSPEEAAAVYVDLLIGDLQIRRATGAMAAPTSADIEIRARRAEHFVVTTFAPDPGTP